LVLRVLGWRDIKGEALGWLVSFEKLNSALMVAGFLQAGESAKIAPLSRFCVLLARVQPVFAGF